MTLTDWRAEIAHASQHDLIVSAALFEVANHMEERDERIFQALARVRQAMETVGKK